MTASLRCRVCGKWSHGADFDDAVRLMDGHRDAAHPGALRLLEVRRGIRTVQNADDLAAADAAEKHVSAHKVNLNAAVVAFPHATEACHNTFEGETQVTNEQANLTEAPRPPVPCAECGGAILAAGFGDVAEARNSRTETEWGVSIPGETEANTQLFDNEWAARDSAGSNKAWCSTVERVVRKRALTRGPWSDA